MNKQSLRDRTTLIVLIALIIMVLCGIAILLLLIFFGDLIPGRQPGVQTSRSPDAVWQRIQANNKIVVGVSADYPPFSYIGPDFVLQGYDIALMQEIGKRIGIPLEVHNMAFDGLINALVLGQIDVAIAAIANTPERDRLVDFTTTYYVGEDAILARADSSVVVVTTRDLAKYRIGVQNGSIYANWVKTNLIDPGYLKPQDLFTFDTYDEGINALTDANPQIDLFMVDLLPALESTKSIPVKIIMQGLNPQDYAIAIPQGAFTLKSTLDSVLADMQTDGTLAKLAQQYLNLEQPLPLPTSLPTQPPVTPSSCVDGMSFVKDLTYPDANMTRPQQVQPGTLIQKGWRIKNTGNCTWDNAYVLSFTEAIPRDAPIGGNPAAIQGLVSPGQTYDIYVTLTAPYQPGKYQSFWNMRAANGAFFGDRIWAGFEVPGQMIPTSTPALQPPVILSFSASSTLIQVGQCLSLSWQYTGDQITGSRLLRNGALLQSNLPLTGSLADCPTQIGQNQYQILVDTAGLGSAVATQIVTVFASLTPTATPTLNPAQLPVIFFFNADDRNITVGQCTNLAWSYGGINISQARIFREGFVIASNLPSSGTFEDCPPEAGQIQYVLRVIAINSAAVQDSEYVSVRNPAPSQPVITSFNAKPTQFAVGSCTNLSWTIDAQGNNKTSLTRNGQVLASGLSYTGSFRDCINDPSLVGQLTYTLQISGTYGSDSKIINITLKSALSSLLRNLLQAVF